jgi:riboflavin biosynthesis pyrimidine reductase
MTHETVNRSLNERDRANLFETPPVVVTAQSAVLVTSSGESKEYQMRPHIICHMGTSIDGRLHPSRFTAPASGVSADALRGHYERVHDRFDADGWIVGRVTMSEMAKGTERPIKDAPALPRTAHVAARNGRKLAIAIDPAGRVHYGKDNVGGDHAVAVLGEQVSDAYLAELRHDGVSYLFAGAKGDDLSHAMEQIATLFGARTLLLEGGGKINGAFLKHKLIDEFSTLIRPAVDGVVGSQCIVDYDGPEGDRPGAGQSLRLTHCETLEGGMIWLRHAVERTS